MTEPYAARTPLLAGALEVDESGLRYRCDEDCALDVLFDGRRVWSIGALEHEKRRDGFRFAAWPEPIRIRLDGRARVELREHVTGDVIAATDGVFGDGAGRVEIVDKQGRPVALTKYGRLNYPFESTDRSALEGYLDQVEEVLGVLRDECGLPAFISFGTLLGAVRTGALIGHDVDVDLGYLSAHDNPVDVVRESLRVERVFRDKGWRVVRQNGGFLALFFPQGDGTSRNLDVFSCFIVNGYLHQVHDVRTQADRSAVLPLGTIAFEGRQMPVPAQPEVFLEAAYGAGWRVPDPSFHYNTPRPLRRRINGWLGGLRARRDHWVKFYGAHGDRVPQEPTEFARWLVSREPVAPLIDVGSGNGRDSLYFAREGFDVTGIDFVPAAVKGARRRADNNGLAAEFQIRNLYSLEETLITGASLSRRPPKVVYARFFLHTLTDPGRENFWRLTQLALNGGGRCYLEFRTRKDMGRRKAFGRGYRNFLSPDQVVAEAAASGATVVHREEGTGLAPFEEENPYICRLVLEWS